MSEPKQGLTQRIWYAVALHDNCGNVALNVLRNNLFANYALL